MNALVDWLARTDGSVALRESLYAYPLVESVHVLTLVLFTGITLMLDLRLIGISMRRAPASNVVTELVPWMLTGFLIMGASGTLLFYANPVRSFHNIFFRFKMLLLLLAGANALRFHVGVRPRIADWDRAPRPPSAARLAGAVSLMLWMAIIVSGRMIAYDWFDCGKTQSLAVRWANGCGNLE